jgi:hypothetical protein
MEQADQANGEELLLSESDDKTLMSPSATRWTSPDCHHFVPRGTRIGGPVGACRDERHHAEKCTRAWFDVSFVALEASSVMTQYSLLDRKTTNEANVDANDLSRTEKCLFPILVVMSGNEIVLQFKWM